MADLLMNRYSLLTDPLMNAIDRRLVAKGAGQYLTAWYLADMLEGSLRPYLVVNPIREEPKGYTSKRREVDVVIELEVAADSFKQLSEVFGKLREAVENAPLEGFFTEVPGWAELQLIYLRPGVLSMVKDDEQWRGAQEYTAKMQQALTHSPA